MVSIPQHIMRRTVSDESDGGFVVTIPFELRRISKFTLGSIIPITTGRSVRVANKIRDAFSYGKIVSMLGGCTDTYEDLSYCDVRDIIINLEDRTIVIHFSYRAGGSEWRARSEAAYYFAEVWMPSEESRRVPVTKRSVVYFP